MHARIAMFDGTPDKVDETVDATRSQIDEGFDSPPEGLEGATEVWMLVDRATGKTVAITLFDTEEDLNRGHEALNAMSPSGPQEGMGRTDVGLYEVAIRKQRG
jgi:hypothetical protein